MDVVTSVLQLAERQAREASRSLPGSLLDRLVEAAGGRGGALTLHGDVLARRGGKGGGLRRIELPGGRDTFVLEVDGGAELDASVRLAAGTVLESWLVREELKKARFAERRRLWEVESLRAISEALGGTLEPSRIAEELLWHAAALLDARRGEVWLDVDGAVALGALLAGADGTVPCTDGSCTVAARIGGQVFTPEEARDLTSDGLLEDRRLAVPISGRRGRLGVLALGDREVRGGIAPFGATDAQTLALFASQAAVALENASLHREDLERQRLERELELAASIQRQLLPSSFPVPAGFEAVARSEPSLHVGGDVYDVLATPEGTILMIADVAGKGVPAALMAASLHAALHVASENGTSVAELARRLHNHLLVSTPDNKFATVFLARLAVTGELEYVSAGHNPVIVVGADGGVSYLRSSDPPLGLLPESRYQGGAARLEAGSLLVAYTDGLSEAPSPDDADDFGVERLADLAVAHRHDPLDAIVDTAFAAVAAFTGQAPAHDDRTILTLRRLA